VKRLIPYLALLALAPAVLPACNSAEAQITNRIQITLDECKAGEGELHKVTFEEGDPFEIYRVLCDQPITDVGTYDLNGEGTVGPYKFQFRQNVKENRWTLGRVTWPEMDEAANYFKQADKADAEYKRIDESLATAMGQAPQIGDIKAKRMKYLMEWRKLHKGKLDTNPTSLGVAEAFYKEGIALAQKDGDKDLEARMRLMVITYWDGKRSVADDAAAPNPQWREWEEAAVKAIEKEAKDARKAGDKKLQAEKLKEAAKRRKSIPDVEAEQNKLKAVWAERAKALLAVECTEIKAASGLLPKDPDLKKEFLAAQSLVTCP
jgi:hypothetical protein